MSEEDIVKVILDILWAFPESIRPSIGYGFVVAAETQSYWTGVAIMVLTGLVYGCVRLYVESWDE